MGYSIRLQPLKLKINFSFQQKLISALQHRRSAYASGAVDSPLPSNYTEEGDTNVSVLRIHLQEQHDTGAAPAAVP